MKNAWKESIWKKYVKTSCKIRETFNNKNITMHFSY